METLKNYFEKQLEEQQEIKFNIFSALHKKTDEVRLHSRFIAYLLSSDANHGMRDAYLKLFMNNILDLDFDSTEYTVKKEDKNIDIVIYNDRKEVIIENKIYAGDQPQQLVKYYDLKTSENVEKEIVKVVYLTLGRHKPSEDSRGNIPCEKLVCIDYTQEINNWLTDCIKITEGKNQLLANTILQYKELITELTSDINQAKENQEEISKKIEEAWELEKQTRFFTQLCKGVFKHVKWHTVADFINELENALVEKEAITIEKPSAKNIASITHNNNKKGELIIKFKFNNQEMQIVNDSKGFTLGNLTKGKWDCFSEDIKDVKFCDFSKKQTFYLIKKQNRERIINKMVHEIQLSYKSLNKDF